MNYTFQKSQKIEEITFPSHRTEDPDPRNCEAGMVRSTTLLLPLFMNFSAKTAKTWDWISRNLGTGSYLGIKECISKYFSGVGVLNAQSACPHQRSPLSCRSDQTLQSEDTVCVFKTLLSSILT